MVQVEEVTPTSPTSIRVVFGDRSARHPGVMDPDAYCFTNSLDALGVLRIDDKTVEVQTTPQRADVVYDLEVSLEEEAQEG